MSESWSPLAVHLFPPEMSKLGNIVLNIAPDLGLLFQEGSVYFLEGGPFLGVSPPAAQHDLVE